MADRASTLERLQTPVSIEKSKPFKDSDGFRARLKGISGTATAGQTTNIDYKLTEERWINGCDVILKDQAFGDKASFQVVDVDNILGYGTVLDTFASDWYFSEDAQDQGIVQLNYPAKIIANLYIRISYTSVGQNNVSVKCNLVLHQKT